MLALSGCVPTAEPDPIPPTPTVTPVFATEEEALAAAEAAYREYLAVSDAILADGGRDRARLQSVATGEALQIDTDGFAEFEANGLRSVGLTTYSGFSLQSYDPSAPAGANVVRAYVCADVSKVDVLDAHGASVVDPSRQSVTRFEVGFDQVSNKTRALIVSSKDVWSGDTSCP